MADPTTGAPGAPATSSTGTPPESTPAEKPSSTGTPDDKPAAETKSTAKPDAGKDPGAGKGAGEVAGGAKPASSTTAKAAEKPGEKPGGRAEASATTAAAAAEPEIPDSREFDLDGERVTFADLKEGYQLIQEAATAKQRAEQAERHVTATLRSLVERGANGGPQKLSLDGIRNLLALANGGNREIAEELLVEAASQVISERIKWEEMPAEYRDGELAKRRLQDSERQLKAYREREAKERRRREMQEARTALLEKFSPALKAVGIKETKESLGDLSDILLKAHERGLSWTPERAARELKKIYDQRRAEYLAETDPKDFPPESIEALRKRDLETVKEKLSAAPARSGDEEEKEPQARRRRRTAGIF